MHSSAVLFVWPSFVGPSKAHGVRVKIPVQAIQQCLRITRRRETSFRVNQVTLTDWRYFNRITMIPYKLYRMTRINKVITQISFNELEDIRFKGKLPG